MLNPEATGTKQPPGTYVDWRVESYGFTGATPRGYAVAFASLREGMPEVGTRMWQAYCAGPGDDERFEGWYHTADEAKAAIGLHIAGGAQ